jgi:plasmid stabilization system protein ParE
MKFRVVIESPAQDDIENSFRWILEDSPQNAIAWYTGIREATLTLATFPERCPIAPENQYFDQEIRQRIFKSHRILFTIRENTVHVLHVRHSTMQYWKEGK